MPRPTIARRPGRALAAIVALVAAASVPATSGSAAASASGSASASAAASASAPTGQRGAWSPIFADEFDGSALDASRWYPNRWFAASCARGATHGELAYYTGRPSNVSVGAGALRLVARREPFFTCGEASWAGRGTYTSGWVQTGGARASDGSLVQPGFTMSTGFVEARVRLPAGRGLWPAMWLLSTRRDGDGKRRYPSRPEIDAFEVVGHAPDVWQHHVHFDGVDEGHAAPGPSSAAGWHTIGLHRERGRLTWYVDGRRTWRYAGPGVPDPGVRMYVILNLAVGGEWPGAPADSTAFPATMLVDYVRAWRPAPTPSVRIVRPSKVVQRRPVTIVATASARGRVRRMELRVGGRLVKTTRSRRLRYRWRPGARRRYTLRVTAIDAAGGRGRAVRRITVAARRAPARARAR